jgi:hypothetical protein
MFFPETHFMSKIDQLRPSKSAERRSRSESLANGRSIGADAAAGGCWKFQYQRDGKHNETRSWHSLHRRVSLVLLTFAMMTA